MIYTPIMVAVLLRILEDERDLANWYAKERDDALRLAA